jgi:hypothetical protein
MLPGVAWHYNGRRSSVGEKKIEGIKGQTSIKTRGSNGPITLHLRLEAKVGLLILPRPSPLGWVLQPYWWRHLQSLICVVPYQES